MLRPLQHSDIDRLCQLWLFLTCASHPTLPVNFWQSQLAEFQQMLEQDCPPGDCIWVYTSPGECRADGLVAVKDGDQLCALLVAPNIQRRGVGSELMEQAKFDRPQLQLALFEENLGGRFFCQQHGFEELQRRNNISAAQVELVMCYRGSVLRVARG